MVCKNGYVGFDPPDELLPLHQPHRDPCCHPCARASGADVVRGRNVHELVFNHLIHSEVSMTVIDTLNLRICAFCWRSVRDGVMTDEHERLRAGFPRRTPAEIFSRDDMTPEFMDVRHFGSSVCEGKSQNLHRYSNHHFLMEEKLPVTQINDSNRVGVSVGLHLTGCNLVEKVC